MGLFDSEVATSGTSASYSLRHKPPVLGHGTGRGSGREHAAFHEAGHAVMAFHHRRRVHSASIHSDGGGRVYVAPHSIEAIRESKLGRLRDKPWSQWVHNRNVSDVSARAEVHLAGLVAAGLRGLGQLPTCGELMNLARCAVDPLDFARSNTNRIEVERVWISLCTNDDLGKTVNELAADHYYVQLRLGDDPQTLAWSVSGRLLAIQSDVRRVLAHHSVWPGVTYVAAALMERGTLPGVKVEAILHGLNIPRRSAE